MKMLNKNIILVVVFTLLCQEKIFSQQEYSNWYFGNYCGLTFNTSPPSFLAGSRIHTGEGCSTISDTAGNLLFYSDGMQVWDRNHNLMPNGTGLHGNTSSSQSCMICRHPLNINLYYLFTAPDYSFASGLEYSIIDMSLNNGFGDVTSVKNVTLMSNSTEKLTAIEHSNDRDFWVIGHKFQSNEFYAFLVTPNGINLNPVISASGRMHQSYINQGYSDQNKIGCMKVSPCGDKIACAVLYDDFVELHDFDNTTGIVSNPLVISQGPYLFPYGYYGVEFSEGCSKLYVSIESPPVVVQYDLTVGSPQAIINSADTVATSSFDYYGALQNGPDGKIYLARIGNNFLGCITSPDSAGASCNYVSNYADAGGSAMFGLPAALVTSKGKTTAVEYPDEIETVVYPNPFSDMISLNFNDGREHEIRITTVTGFMVYHEASTSLKVSIPCHNFNKGIYFLYDEVKGIIKIYKIIKI